ncbi:hypothetical protein D9C73_019362 [Collichthys lucidus]|uniref:Uncharacterized protein n=1 Tax=Collichthys lucidus TaxID=240159 RepID=A0A4U5VE90_COLLU|nr:hypothetical protein D9C73_019362 [Collichthys lucidus]
MSSTLRGRRARHGQYEKEKSGIHLFHEHAGTDLPPIRGHTRRSRSCTSLKNSFYRRIWTQRRLPREARDEASQVSPGAKASPLRREMICSHQQRCRQAQVLTAGSLTGKLLHKALSMSSRSTRLKGQSHLKRQWHAVQRHCAETKPVTFVCSMTADAQSVQQSVEQKEDPSSSAKNTNKTGFIFPSHINLQYSNIVYPLLYERPSKSISCFPHSFESHSAYQITLGDSYLDSILSDYSSCYKKVFAGNIRCFSPLQAQVDSGTGADDDDDEGGGRRRRRRARWEEAGRTDGLTLNSTETRVKPLLTHFIHRERHGASDKNWDPAAFQNKTHGMIGRAVTKRHTNTGRSESFRFIEVSVAVKNSQHDVLMAKVIN